MRTLLIGRRGLPAEGQTVEDNQSILKIRFLVLFDIFTELKDSFWFIKITFVLKKDEPFH